MLMVRMMMRVCGREKVGVMEDGRWKVQEGRWKMEMLSRRRAFGEEAKQLVHTLCT